MGRVGPLLLQLVAAWAAGLAPAMAQTGSCSIMAAATLPLEIRGGHYVTRVGIAGAEQAVVVDTGASASVVDAALAKQLALPARKGEVGLVVAGGSGRAARVVARSFTLGSLELGPVSLLARTVSVGDIRTTGLLGADLLSRFDVEFDPAARRLTLHTVKGCADRFIDWPQPYRAARLAPFFGGALKRVSVTLDGVALEALVDTGASQTVLFRRGAARLGAAAKPGPHDRRGYGLGASGRRVATFAHRFGTLVIGDETLQEPELAVADDDPLGLDMILGLDLLGQRRLWMSYATGQLFTGPR